MLALGKAFRASTRKLRVKTISPTAACRITAMLSMLSREILRMVFSARFDL
jgi:hypothetical protein